MEEIALVISSLAGACTAVAMDKFPKIKRNKQTLTVNDAIENQLQSLKMEKDIVTKTIARLHQQEYAVSGIQKDKLLIRYQHQLGIIIAKIEKIETAGKYLDLGPLGDSIISLMDNRLSQLDQRLHEISSKISVNSITQPKHMEKPTETILEQTQIKKIETKIEVQKEKVDTQKDKMEMEKRPPTFLPPIEIPIPEKHRTVELSTLTEITNKIPEFPADLIRPTKTEPHIIQEEIKSNIVIEEPIFVPQPIIQSPKEETAIIELPKPEIIQQEQEKKIQLPTPMKIPEEEKLEDDDKDLDKIKSEIMKALSKLEQVEVE